MKKINKIFAVALGACCSACMLFSAGCKSKVSNDDNTLEIYIGKFGYGVEWLDAVIELFKEQTWVKEKYPDLNIPTPMNNSERNYPANRIMAGANANSIDLFFSCVSASGNFGVKDSGGNSYFEDLTDVYDSEVPGESILLKEKMLPDIYEAQDIQNLDGTTSYYAMPWVNGYEGMLYNKTLIRQYFGEDYVMPRTTEELKKLAADIRAKKSGKTPFISASQYGYWSSAVGTWWAQYEGLESYENYWLGLNDLGERSNEIFSQKGRLRALEVAEDLIGAETGNCHSDTNTMDFTQAQAKFLLGEAFMMQNGDWFENEMRKTQAENPNNYEICFMKMPVISDITEKCSVVKTEESLSFIVQCIDEGKDYKETKAAFASFGDLPENDYARIKEARSVMYRVVGHEAYIPSYATAKDLAKDFLRFLSTDIAIESFIRVTNGVGTPFTYDMQTKNETLYHNLPELHKSRLEIAKTGVGLTPYTSYRLNYYGGLYTFIRTQNIEVAFTAQNKDDRSTAQEIWQRDIDWYTQSNGVNWTSLLNRAGY